MARKNFKKILGLVIFCAITSISSNGCAADMVPNPDAIPGYVPPGTDDVHIGPTGIEIPLGRILLIHSNSKYCALKFTKFWTEKEEKQKFATYEVYCQGDGSGDFGSKNVKFSEGKASLLMPRGFGHYMFQPGNPVVKCESLRLRWDYKGFVSFVKGGKPAGDYGIELAPTPWASIEEVNVLDPHLRWYRYDEGRRRVNIPIEQLWSDKAE